MSSRKSSASLTMVCLIAVGVLGLASVADIASAGKARKQPRESANSRTYVLEGKRRARGPRIHLPIGPSYTYYDYPYYYSRGHYPTHIGGYVYYPYNYYRRGYHARYGGRCSNWIARCLAEWGAASSRRHRGACRCR